MTGRPLSSNYQYLLRESESRGVVDVEFEHGDRHYKIHRVLERAKDDIRQKSDECWMECDGKIIAKGKVDPINEAIASQLQIDPEVLREVAWIKQERLKLLLNLRREERQVLLDGLLGLEELSQIAENLGGAERRLSERITHLERESGGLANDQQDLERKRQQQSKLDAESKEFQKALEENRLTLDMLEHELSEVRERAEDYASQQRDISALQQRLNDLEQSMKKNQATLKRHTERKLDLEEDLKREDQVLQKLQENFQELGFDSQLTRESISSALRDLREKREQLRDKLLLTEHLMDDLKRNMKILQDRDKCPLCRQDMVPLYRSTLLQIFTSELSPIEKQARKLQSDIEKAQASLKALEALDESFSLTAADKYRVQLEETNQIVTDLEKEIQSQKHEHSNAKLRFDELKDTLKGYIGLSDALRKAEEVRNQHAERVAEQDGRLRAIYKQIKDLEREIAVLNARVQEKENLSQEAEQRRSGLQMTQRLRDFVKRVRPRLRLDFLEDLQTEVQRVLDEVSGPEDSSYVELDEYYTPSLVMQGQKRATEQLSGGERTLLAFTLNIGLAQLVYELKSHQSLELLLLDEPTESLGTEDQSIQRLAESIRSMRSVRQIIAVTHSEDFAQHADHILMVTKQLGHSKVEPVT